MKFIRRIQQILFSLLVESTKYTSEYQICLTRYFVLSTIDLLCLLQESSLANLYTFHHKTSMPQKALAYKKLQISGMSEPATYNVYSYFIFYSPCYSTYNQAQTNLCYLHTVIEIVSQCNI